MREEEGVKGEPRRVVAKKNLLIELESVQEEDEEEEIPKHPNKAPLSAVDFEGESVIGNCYLIGEESKKLFNVMDLEAKGEIPQVAEDRILRNGLRVKYMKNLDVNEEKLK